MWQLSRDIPMMNNVSSNWFIMEEPETVSYSKLLEYAITSGNMKEILELLQQNDINVNVDNDDGETTLHLTFKSFAHSTNERIELLEIFLNRGADPNVKNAYGKTVLHMAVENRSLDVVDLLLKHRAKIDATDDQGNSIAHILVKNLFVEFLENAKTSDFADESSLSEQATFVARQLSRGFDFDLQNKNGQSALHLAIEYNLQHILPVLLRRTRDVDFVSARERRTLLQLFLKASHAGTSIVNNVMLTDREGKLSRANEVDSSRHFSQQKYAIEIVKILLDRGVNVGHADNLGQTALDIAITALEDASIVTMLSDRLRKKTLVHSLIKRVTWEPTHRDYYLQILRALVSKDPEVDREDDRGITALYHAVERKNLEAVRVLEGAGANFSWIARDTGNCLLHALAEKKWYDVPPERSVTELFDLLVDKNCDVDSRNIEGRTPLHVAIECNNVVVIEKLLSHGVDVNCHEYANDRTPLHLAARRDSTEVVESLLDHGARVDVEDSRGARPLHLAAEWKNRASMLRMLLERGAAVNARDSQGDTAIVRAVLADGEVNVEELIAHGADVNDGCVTRLLPRCWNSVAGDCLLRHWVKLETADLPRSLEYAAFEATTEMDRRQLVRECSREVEELRGIGFLWGWLRMEPNRRHVHARNEELRDFIESTTLAKRFPRYVTVILGCYRDAVARRALLQEPATEAWIELTGICLPDVCLERIFAHLSTGCLVEIVEFVNDE